jgi:hypothetical protein
MIKERKLSGGHILITNRLIFVLMSSIQQENFYIGILEPSFCSKKVDWDSKIILDLDYLFCFLTWLNVDFRIKMDLLRSLNCFFGVFDWKKG